MSIINNNKGTIRNQSKAATATATTITTALTTYPHEVGRELIPELAMRVYSSPLDAFREAISNAFDENSQKVVLFISNDKIAIEDWGNGIRDYDEFRKFGQASKKLRKEEEGEVIGEKGLGKLSLLNLGNCVCFETNNGNVGMKFYMTLGGFSSPIYKKTAAFVSHVGTRISSKGLFFFFYYFQDLHWDSPSILESYVQWIKGMRCLLLLTDSKNV
jgi:hypothetical protein